jgi:transcriptional regulator with XRE-family HTH domain
MGNADAPADRLTALLQLVEQPTHAAAMAEAANPNSLFGRLLRTERACLGLTQEQLAERSGLSIGTISDLERGRNVSRRRTSIRRLSDALGFSWAQLSDRLFDDAVEPMAVGDVNSAVDDKGLRSRAMVVPRQLPPGVRHFAGRRHELTALDSLAEEAGTRPIIVVVSGPKGVGKNALALHWAHANAGRFPDGQLYADLHGTSRCGMLARSAWDVLRSFLESLDRPTDRMPIGLENLSAFYRSVLARKRILIMLNDVSSVEQVRPLLPASRGSVVLVTSRSTLAGLVATEGAHELTLAGLDQGDSRQLLANMLGEQRIVAERNHVSALIARCAGSPCELSSAAAEVVTRPGVSIATIVADVACETS